MANVPILFLPFGTLSELLVLLVDLHNGTSTKKHIRVKGPLPATGLRRLGITKGKLNFWI